MRSSLLAILAIHLAAALFCLPSVRGQQASGPSMSVSISSSLEVQIAWPASASDYVLEEAGRLDGIPAWQAVAKAPQLQNGQLTVALAPAETIRFYRLRQAAVVSTFRISRHTPLDGATEVGVTFRPQVFFSEPVNPTTLTSGNFFGSAAGTPVEANIVPANDGTFAWLFFKQALPGGTRVRLTVDGSTITAARGGARLDADGNGQAGSIGTFAFTTAFCFTT